MKRIVSLLITVAMILSFSLVTFAFEDEATITVTSNMPATVEPGETVNVEFYFNAGDDLEVNGAYAGVRLYYPAELTLSNLADGGYGIFQAFPDKTEGSEKYIYFNGETEDTFTVTSSAVAMKATFVVPENATNGTVYTFKTLAKSNNLDDMNDGGMATISDATFTTTVTVGSADHYTVAIASTKYTDANGKEWTGVPNAEITLNDVTGTSIGGTIDINYTKGTEDKTATGVAATAMTGNFTNTTVTFKVAIIGVPSDVTVTSFVPNFNVQ